MDTQRFESYQPIFSDRTVRLHSMLINCGHQLTENHGYLWDGTKRGPREMVIWQYTLSGLGRLRFNGVEHPVPPGTAMFIVVPENHCYYLPRESAYWEFLYVSVNGSELVRLAAELRRRRGILFEHAPDSPAVGAAWEVLRMFHGNRPPDRYEASVAAYRFITSLLAESERTGETGNEPWLRQIHDYCLANLSRPVTVEELADVAGCSRSHFSRRFKLVEGVSPHEFVSKLKMRLAVRLLQSGEGNIKTIAGECGFDDASYFCRVFKETYGVTPGEFRLTPPTASGGSAR